MHSTTPPPPPPLPHNRSIELIFLGLSVASARRRPF
jgi:hypothetical protein